MTLSLTHSLTHIQFMLRVSPRLRFIELLLACPTTGEEWTEFRAFLRAAEQHGVQRAHIELDLEEVSDETVEQFCSLLDLVRLALSQLVDVWAHETTSHRRTSLTRPVHWILAALTQGLLHSHVSQSG